MPYGVLDNYAMQCKLLGTSELVPEPDCNVQPTPILHQTVMRITVLYRQYEQTPLWKSPVHGKVKKPTIRANFWLLLFLGQQHDNTKPTKTNTTKYILFDFI